MMFYAITDTKKGRTGIAPTYLQTTPARLYEGSKLPNFRILAYFSIQTRTDLTQFPNDLEHRARPICNR